MDGNCYYSYLFSKLNQCFAISIIRFYIVKEANHAQKSKTFSYFYGGGDSAPDLTSV